MIRRIKSPGKFEGEDALSLAIYEMLLDGGGDEFEGDEFSGESFTLIRGPFTMASLNGKFDLLTYHFNHPSLNRAERKYLKRQAGAILYESSQGFITTTRYTSEKDLDKAWNKVSEMFEEVEDDA